MTIIADREAQLELKKSFETTAARIAAIEAELAAERARLDWFEGDEIAKWVKVRFRDKDGHNRMNIREAIDAARKETG